MSLMTAQEQPTEKELIEDMASAVTYVTKFAAFRDTEELLYYDDGVFLEGGHIRVKEWVEDRSPVLATTHFVNEVVSKVTRRSYVDRDDFDSDPYLLNCLHGYLDLRTMEYYHRDGVNDDRGVFSGNGKPVGLKVHTDRMFRTKLPVEYAWRPGLSRRCPEIMKFLAQVVPDVKERRLLLEYLSTILFPSASTFQKALMLIGEGNNGKSTLIRLLQALLGKANYTNQSIHDLLYLRFRAAELDGKLANFYPDISSEEIERTGFLKGLIAGDTLSAEKKGSHPFKLEPYAKHVFSCNTLPLVKDNTDAWFRRWVIIYFREIFDGEKEDKHVLERMVTPEELSGFLFVLVHFLKRLLERGGKFTSSPTTEQMRKEWGERANPVISFIGQEIERGGKFYLQGTEVYERYVAWSEDKDFFTMGKKAFLDQFRRELPLRETVIKPQGKSLKVLVGARIKGMIFQLGQHDVTLEASTDSTNSTNPHSRVSSEVGSKGEVSRPVESVEKVVTPEPVQNPSSSPNGPGQISGAAAQEVPPGAGELKRSPVPSIKSASFEKASAGTQANCAVCGKLIGTGAGSGIFWYQDKTYDAEHWPGPRRKGEGEAPA